MRSSKLFDHPSFMEPLVPDDQSGELAGLALELMRKAERLRDALHPVTRRMVAELVRSMNSYYSNLIEGHRTTPRDIEAALNHDFSSNARQRALQIQHVAHIEVQTAMEQRLTGEGKLDLCGAEFFCWIHREFYQRLPDALREVEGVGGERYMVVPGTLREAEVSVGRHLAPLSKKVNELLKRFAAVYGPEVKGDPRSLVMAAAAHHRLTWIHPFLDGNGRVARLFTQAWFARAEVTGGGLWAISRGLVRRQNDYKATLANADERRINDLDGRGYLSQRHLVEFCRYFLQTGVDQVDFMRELLALDAMQTRLVAYVARLEATNELPRGAARVLREVFLRGEIARGEVHQIMGVTARTAQKLTGQLVTRRLLISDSPKGLLRLGFPADAAGYYFPNLFPAGAD